MKTSLYETLYDEVIEFLQASGGSSEMDTLITSVRVKYPNSEYELRELIWYLISHQKLTCEKNIVSITLLKSPRR